MSGVAEQGGAEGNCRGIVRLILAVDAMQRCGLVQGNAVSLQQAMNISHLQACVQHSPKMAQTHACSGHHWSIPRSCPFWSLWRISSHHGPLQHRNNLHN